MEIDIEAYRSVEVFCPGTLDKYRSLEENDIKFVHYTSSDIALNILKHKKVWFRNISVMNDYSEVRYGLEMLDRIIRSNLGGALKDAVNSIYPGSFEHALEYVIGSEMSWRLETYIACLSEHLPTDNFHGRLSMWRAYGDTALVLKRDPLLRITDAIGVYSFPILYYSEERLKKHFKEVVLSIENNSDYLKSIGDLHFRERFKQMFFRLAIGLKHPGFEEEKEWRVYYQPTTPSEVMKKQIETIAGVPQIVYVLSLNSSDDPENNVLDMATELDQIIIGPNKFPYVISQAFLHELTEQNIRDAEQKVVYSNIPLRR